jgi:hypothetical protein
MLRPQTFSRSDGVSYSLRLWPVGVKISSLSDDFVSVMGRQCYAKRRANPDGDWGCIIFCSSMRNSSNNNDNYYQSLIGLI